MEREWSAYQRAVFTDFEDDTGNTAVRARAGSGKTSTIVEGLKYVPRGRRALLCAFNRSIKDELSKRAPPGVDVRTIHSLGHTSCGRAFGRFEVEEKKTHLLAKRVLLGLEGELNKTNREYLGEQRVAGSSYVAQLAGYAKNTLCPLNVQALQDLAEDRDIETETLTREQLARATLRTLKDCLELKSILDYDDMIWFPWQFQLRSESHDLVTVDEVQDLNPAQFYLVSSSMRKGGRLVAVGDDRQAIYAFRGAGRNSFEELVREFNARVLPLSISYRCPKKVVALARQIVPDFEAPKSAIEGTIDVVRSVDAMLPNLRPGDFVLSRSNAPLAGICRDLLKRGVPACIAGKDIGRGLRTFIEKFEVNEVSELFVVMQTWLSEQIERYRRLEKEEKIQQAVEKVSIVHALAEGAKDVPGLLLEIDRLFRDDDSHTRVVCSTVHKAKGLERDRVFVLNETFSVDRSVEEANLYYVAITRTRDYLALVGGGT
jgi:DNA helicase-2/ATP-dependent DNA helicase PcrA